VSAFALLLGLALAGAPPAPTGVEAELRSAIDDYEFGEHAQAAKKLVRLLEPLRLTRAEDVILARQYLGACHFLLDDRTRAESEFAKTLALDPEHKLDPGVFSPAIVQFFEDVRARTGLGLRPREEPRASPTPSPVPSPSPAAPPTAAGPPPPAPPPLALAFVPFGVGQFANAQPLKGAAFAIVEVGLFVTAAVAFVTFQGLQCPPTECAPDPRGAAVFRDVDDASRASTAQSVALGTFYGGLGVVALGIIDALVFRSSAASVAAAPDARADAAAALRVTPSGFAVSF
jgi:hypothetical protein